MCGFGLAEAGAGAAHAIATHPGAARDGVVLAGAAGTYDAARMPVGEAMDASAVRVHGIGAGGSSPAELGFAAADVIALPGGGGELLSVATAAATPEEAAGRARSHPAAVAEEMEGYAVAVAADRFGVHLRVVRGISNMAGDRDRAGWRMAEALAAVGAALRERA